MEPNLTLFEKGDRGEVLYKKINGSFQLIELNINSYLNSNPTKNFLKLVNNFIHLKCLFLESADYEYHELTSFDTLL